MKFGVTTGVRVHFTKEDMNVLELQTGVKLRIGIVADRVILTPHASGSRLCFNKGSGTWSMQKAVSLVGGLPEGFKRRNSTPVSYEHNFDGVITFPLPEPDLVVPEPAFLMPEPALPEDEPGPFTGLDTVDLIKQARMALVELDKRGVVLMENSDVPVAVGSLRFLLEM